MRVITKYFINFASNSLGKPISRVGFIRPDCKKRRGIRKAERVGITSKED